MPISFLRTEETAEKGGKPCGGGYEMIEKGEQEDKISLYYDRFMVFCIIASVLPLCVKNSTNPVFYRIDLHNGVYFHHRLSAQMGHGGF